MGSRTRGREARDVRTRACKGDRMWRTRPIASPIIKTSVWSATVWGDVRKKKPRVIWNRHIERMIVPALMRGIVASWLVFLLSARAQDKF